MPAAARARLWLRQLTAGNPPALGAPAGRGAGVRRGVLNLTMAGEWALTAELSRGGQRLGSAEFRVEVSPSRAGD